MVEDTATALAFGESPGQYHFDQQNMCCHLYSGTVLREGRCHLFQQAETGHRINYQISRSPSVLHL